jgi:putative ABC transport system permease protein
MSQSLSLTDLAFRNLFRRPWRSLSLMTITALAAWAILGTGLLGLKISKGLDGLAARLGADILVVPGGYQADAQAALLRGEPSTFYMDSSLTGLIREIDGVEAATPQFYLSSLEADCCASEIQLIGFDPESDFILGAWNKGPIPEVGDDQILIGADINLNLSGTIMFYNRLFRVAGQLEPSGLGLDHSVFMTLPAIYRLIRENNSIAIDSPEAFISSVAVKTLPGQDPRSVALEIEKSLGQEKNLETILTSRLAEGLASRMEGVSTIMLILALGSLALTFLSLALVHSLSVKERSREIGLYRTLGASRSYLVRLFLRESLFLSLGGALAGIILAILTVFPFETLILEGLELPGQALGPGLVLTLSLVALAIGALTGPLASIKAALNIASLEVYGTVREGE